MALVKVKPTSPGRRSLVKVVNRDLHRGRPHGPPVTGVRGGAQLRRAQAAPGVLVPVSHHAAVAARPVMRRAGAVAAMLLLLAACGDETLQLFDPNAQVLTPL